MTLGGERMEKGEEAAEMMTGATKMKNPGTRRKPTRTWLKYRFLGIGTACGKRMKHESLMFLVFGSFSRF